MATKPDDDEWAGRPVGAGAATGTTVRLTPPVSSATEPMDAAWAGRALGLRTESPAGGPWAQGLSSVIHGAVSDPIDTLANDTIGTLRARAINSLLGTNMPEPPPPEASSVRPLVGAGLEAVGLPANPPPTMTNLVAEGVGGGAGPGLLGRLERGAVRVGRGLLERAGVVGPAVAPAAAAAIDMGPAVRLLRPLASEPVVQGIAGGASGASQSLLMGSDAPDWVKTLAPIAVGATTGATAKSVANVGRLIYAGSGSERAARTAASGALLGTYDKPEHALDSLLNYKPDPADTLAPFRTSAEVVDQPGGYIGERVLRSTASPTGDQSFVTRDAGRQAERERLVVPGPLEPGDVDVAGYVAGERARRYGELDAAHQDIGPAPAKIAEPGEALQQQAIAARAASRADYEALRSTLDPDNSSAIPTKTLRDLINKRAEQEFGTDPANWPGIFKTINARLNEEGGRTASIQTLDSVRQDAISLANSPSADPKPKGIARDLAAAIGEHIDQAAALGQGVSAKDAGIWNQMRVAWKQHAERFDPVADVTKKTPGGTPEMGGYTVPGQFWQAGTEGGNAMRAFGKVFVDPATGEYTPAATEQLRKIIAHELGSMVGPDGQLDRATLRDYLKARREAIGELKSPELRQQIGNLDKAQQLVTDYNTTQGSQRDATVNAASLFAKKDVRAALNEALSGSNSERMTTDLVHQLRGSPIALEGLRNAYREIMADHFRTTSPTGVGDQMGQSSAAAEKFFKKHQAVSDILFAGDPDTQATLERLRRDFLSSNKQRTTGAASGSDTFQRLSNFDIINAHMEGSGLPAWASPAQHKLLATLNSFGPVRNLMSEGTTRARAALIEAAARPEAAADMFRAADPVSIERAIGRLNGINWAGVGTRGIPGAQLGTQPKRRRDDE